jgi:hypothetical protein
MSDYVFGFIIKEFGSQEEAERNVGTMKKCPKLIAAGTTGPTAYALYRATRQNSWWLDYPSLFPESRSKAYIIENPIHPNTPLEITPTDSPPCGAICWDYPFIKSHGCTGCMAISQELVNCHESSLKEFN